MTSVLIRLYPGTASISMTRIAALLVSVFGLGVMFQYSGSFDNHQEAHVALSIAALVTVARHRAASLRQAGSSVSR